MTDNVSPILAPERGAMLGHLIALFGRAMEGRIEITAIKAAGKDERVSPRTHFFDLDEMDEAVAWAAAQNADPQWNVYVGAALRKPGVFPGMAADDDDFLKTYAVWADADSEEQVAQAKAAYQRAGLPPATVVVTGRIPHRRAQFWWPLETPIDDIETLRATVRGVADALGTDHGVLTGKQLMRLAGSLAWPKPNKPGRVLERTELLHPDGAPREVALEALHQAFPATSPKPMVPEHREEHVGTLAGVLAARDLRSALASMRSDDRELWVRMGHALRELGDVGMGLWLEWSQTSDKYDPGDAMRVWNSLRGERTGYQAVFAEAQRRGWTNPASGGTRPAEPTPEAEPSADAGDVFEVLSIADLRALPDAQWLIKDAIPADGLVFIYGPPASFKSFVCYDLALSYAYETPSWLGRERKASGSVLYLASEGIHGAKNRIEAWQRENGVAEDTTRFHLIRKTINFLSPEDRARLYRTVKAHIEAHGPVSLIFVDTVSRVLPGADENLQKDMTIFVGACDALREFGATVVGVHHTNKSGEMRGSTVFTGQGDAVYRVDRDDGAKTGVLTCEKLKDGEDGWKRAFEAREQTWTPTGRIEPITSLVAVFGGEPRAEDPAGAWPPRAVCRDVLKSLHEAWTRGKPWSPYPQTSKEGRFAIRNISQDHELPSPVAQMMVEAWLKNDVLSLEVFDTHSKSKGLRVLQWLD